MTKSKTHSQGGHSIEAYKGYLIQPALMGDVFYVQKDGFTIASCPTHAATKAAIDEVIKSVSPVGESAPKEDRA